MTQVIRNNKTITELQAEPDYEWQDGDDSALWDDGYREGITKAITILDSVRQQPEVDRLPSGFTVSVVIATLRKVLEGED
jgi:hypothetical protein